LIRFFSLPASACQKISRMQELRDRVAIVTGASRGIGKTIALALAGRGAKVAVAAKTTQARPELPGTIHETASAIKERGGEAIAVPCNVRHVKELQNLVDQVMAAWGRIDILINNAGAIWVEGIENTPEKRFDLVMEVNFKAPFFLCQLCAPIMSKGEWGHIINMSPPVNPADAAGKIAYMASKFNMTFLAHGLAGELRGQNIAINALWPHTLVESQATINWEMGKPEDWRRADILADATLAILEQNPASYSGQALIDEEVLRDLWQITDFARYNVVPGSQPRRLDSSALSGLKRI
jgi:NAD(P)-dependent dehydrogenase (short-subunit alcohol dehydrogenase family)